jgi:nitrogen regulatory protein PII
MKLLVFVLNKEELLSEVMSAYLEAGIPGATILDSEGMGRFLTYKIPLFAGFKDFMRGSKPRNKTIIAVLKDESILPNLEKLLDAICGGLSTPGTGILFTVPVDYCRGWGEPKEERL